MERSIREAYYIADTTDDAIQSNEELSADRRTDRRRLHLLVAATMKLDACAELWCVL